MKNTEKKFTDYTEAQLKEFFDQGIMLILRLEDGEEYGVLKPILHKIADTEGNLTILHREDGAAVEWIWNNETSGKSLSDGFYYLNGVEVPKDLVMTPANDLDVNRLLNDEAIKGNVSVRREFIKKVGYTRILKDLDAKLVDSWREYTLYVIDKKVDVEPIHLVKMTCPSTRQIYVTRVSPKATTARLGATEINNGVDPQRFIAES